MKIIHATWRGAYTLLVGRAERDHLEGLGVDGRIILNWTVKAWDLGMYWIDLAQNMDKLRVLVNAVMNLRVL
jgi:hypothetical protein